jgi:fumarylacetoacetate (FAA) hydrolase
MKLASLRNNGKDGNLVVVSRDLKMAVKASSVAITMQQALDHWAQKGEKLEELSQQLHDGQCKKMFPFYVQDTIAPLPRAYQWADGSAYVNHVELVRKARGATMPENFWKDPLMYQGGSDVLLSARDDILVADESYGIDFEAEIAVITDAVPMGVPEEDAAQHIKLIMLANDVSLRNLIPDELAKGFGFFQSKPPTAFSPVAVTPDELGDAWRDSKVHLRLYSTLNGKTFGKPNAGVDMTFNFAQLIAHAAKTRPLSPGTIIGSGTVSNIDRSAGSSCIVEKRMLEVLEHGEATTPFMKFGDQIRIEMFDAGKQNIFGAIDQKVVKYRYDKAV